MDDVPLIDIMIFCLKVGHIQAKVSSGLCNICPFTHLSTRLTLDAVNTMVFSPLFESEI